MLSTLNLFDSSLVVRNIAETRVDCGIFQVKRKVGQVPKSWVLGIAETPEIVLELNCRKASDDFLTNA